MNNPKISVNQQENGFSLLELLVAIILLLIVTNIIGSYGILSRKSVRQSNILYTAKQMAASSLELAKNKLDNADSLSSVLKPDTSDTNWYYETVDSQTVKGTDYEVKVRYTHVSRTVPLMKIQATVSWDKTHNYQLNTAYCYMIYGLY